MNRIATALVIGAGLIAATTVIAAEDPIANRQQIMKNTGAAMGVITKMVEGETEFDADVALIALRALNSGALGFGELFPDGSGEGETRAAPAIWENADDFAAKAAKFAADTSAAVASPAGSVEELAAARGLIGGNCGGCHETYRLARQ